ncbi:MAG TPA: aminotransferase class V-fold PLP-dependent enzyme [Pseudonocardia sp.]|jgi:selenocysteine lyase/cysteine desulfurase
MIHLNTAGAGLPAPAVFPAMTEYLAAEAELGPYEAEERYAAALTGDVYEALAALVGADPTEVALFGSATDAWCRVVCNLRLPRGSRVWVTPYEYAGNLAALRLLCDRFDARLEVVPTLPGGDLDLDRMAARLDERVALVSVPHMPSGCGTVLPVERVGALLAGSAAVYVVDACQTVGQVPVNVAAIGADLVTAAGRKFLCGPRGSGFAVVARRIWDRVEPPFHDLHVAEIDPTGKATVTVDTAAMFETAERNNAVVVGLSAAARHARTAPDIDPDVFPALLDAVRETPGVRLHAPGSRQSGIVAFSHETLAPQAIRAGLGAAGINGWVGTGSHTPIYYAAEGVSRFVRLSVHHYNDLGQVAAVRRVLADIT